MGEWEVGSREDFGGVLGGCLNISAWETGPRVLGRTPSRSAAFSSTSPLLTPPPFLSGNFARGTSYPHLAELFFFMRSGAPARSPSLFPCSPLEVEPVLFPFLSLFARGRGGFRQRASSGYNFSADPRRHVASSPCRCRTPAKTSFPTEITLLSLNIPPIQAFSLIPSPCFGHHPPPQGDITACKDKNGRKGRT